MSRDPKSYWTAALGQASSRVCPAIVGSREKAKDSEREAEMSKKRKMKAKKKETRTNVLRLQVAVM